MTMDSLNPSENFTSAQFFKKIVHSAHLLQALEHLSKPIVFTNGVFDLLHRGHVTYLDQARQQGASLVVAINSDHSVKCLGKGSDRPINSQNDRMAVLAALQAVDIVTYFEESTPINLILAIRPDILVKGGDWAIENIVGASEILGWGGRVLSIPFEVGRSTTAILKKIRSLG